MEALRPGASEAKEIYNLSRINGVVVATVDEGGNISKESYLVLSVYFSGFSGEANGYKHLNVVPLVTEDGIISYKPEPMWIERGTKVIVLADLNALGNEAFDKFMKPTMDDERKPEEQRIYTKVSKK